MVRKRRRGGFEVILRAGLNIFPMHMLGKVVDIRPGERAALFAAFAYFFCLLCGYYLLRPLRDALGVRAGAGQLQWLFTATFACMLLMVPVFGAVTTRWPPRRFVPIVYRFFALSMIGFCAWFYSGEQEVLGARAFFVWLSVFNLFVVSIFWSVMADRFSSEQGKRLFGFIAAGGTAGSLVGPGLAAVLVPHIGAAGLAVMAATLLEIAVWCFYRLAPGQVAGRGRPFEAREARDVSEAGIGQGAFAGITLILRDRYLAGIVLYLLLHTFASTVLYFEQARVVAAALTDTVSRTRFFALVDFGVSFATITLQTLLTGRLLQRFGIGFALVLLPVATLFAVAVLTFWPGLAALAAAQGLRRSIDFAVARPAREVLFTVVDRAAKYQAKNVIETVVYRGGDAISGWIFAGLTAAGAGMIGIMALFTPLAIAWSFLARQLGNAQARRAATANTDPGEGAGKEPGKDSGKATVGPAEEGG